MCLAHRALNRRTVAGIQEKVTEKCGRSRLSRLIHAKNDKDTIAAWTLDLGGILRVFNVSFVVPVQPLLLTVHSQTELIINTHVVVSDVHHGVVTTHAMVSDIHRSILKGQEGTDDPQLSVSDICTPFHHRINKWPPLPRHQPGQGFQLPIDPMSYMPT